MFLAEGRESSDVASNPRVRYSLNTNWKNGWSSGRDGNSFSLLVFVLFWCLGGGVGGSLPRARENNEKNERISEVNATMVKKNRNLEMK